MNLDGLKKIHSRYVLSKSREYFEIKQIKPSLCSRYHAEACIEWRGPSPQFSSRQHSSAEGTSQWWRVVGDSVSDSTGPVIEPQTYRPNTNDFNNYANQRMQE